MKRNITLVATGLALLAIGFACGRFFQHANTGYHHQVRDTKEYDSPIGPIRWSYVTESVGTPLLDPGTTLLEVEGRTIYKARRGSRESFPYARNIRTTENGIAWEDGEYQFDLTIQRMKSAGQE